MMSNLLPLKSRRMIAHDLPGLGYNFTTRHFSNAEIIHLTY